jgi:peptidoglycan/LPS O-acetylase OafA/YrhL
MMEATLGHEASSRERAHDPGYTFGHHRALDGVRGIAISVVVLFHVDGLPFTGGFVGVDVFFVLSGFLITSLLYEEWSRASTIALGSFYARRALRILPPLVLMTSASLLFAAMLGARGRAGEMLATVIKAFAFVANWFNAFVVLSHQALGHVWSLSIEEQFYLVWPIVLLTMLRRGWTRWAIGGLLIVASLGSACARALYWAGGAGFFRAYYSTDSRVDGLLLGSLAALLVAWRVGPRSCVGIAVQNALATLALVSVVVISLVASVSSNWIYDFGLLLLNVGIAVLLSCLVTSPWTVLRAILELGPVVWLGRISYGVYLWHVPTFWAADQIGWSSYVLGRLVPAAIAILIAAASFYLVERPLLRLRSRFPRSA